MSFRISYHDVAARATAAVPRDRLARAIERLSASYREGRPVGEHRTSEGRAAYLVHTLPAHVCDQRRLLLDELEALIARPTLRVLAIGAGPGTEALALLDAWAHLAARDGRPPGELLEVVRLDRVGSWDESFAALRAVAEPALRELDPSLGTAWHLQAPAASLACDLLAPLDAAVFERARVADLIVGANVLSELEPRGSPTLPSVFLENVAALARAAKPGAALLLLDRGRAPGVRARLQAALGAAATARSLPAPAIRDREVRCACALTRETKALYAKLRLPTTKVEDRPIGSARTAWGLVAFGGSEPAG